MKFSPIRVYLLSIIAQVCYCATDQTAIPIDPEITAQIDNFITNLYLSNAGITGLGISIVKITDDGHEVYSNGYGMADQEKGISNGNQTQFLIASVTKSLTSTVVVKALYEKFPEMGEAVLDTPIRTLIPSANFTLIDRFRSEHGTFRDLLAHRMCIGNDDLLSAAEAFTNMSEIVYRQRYAEVICGIRTEFQYSNAMFLMAGELIGILTDKSFENLVEELLIEIGMLNSTLGKRSDDYSNLPFRARPYYVLDNVSHPMNTDLLKRSVNSLAAGGLWTTPDDMAKYLSFHLNLGKVGETQVIPESIMKWLRMPSNLLSYPNSFKSSEEDKIVNFLSYGLGLMRGSYDGWEYLQHSGYFNPFSSLVSLFPSQKIGIFTSSNQSPLSVWQEILHTHIFEIFRDSANALEKCSKLIERGKIAEAQRKRKQNKIVENFLGVVSTCQEGGVSKLPNITGQYGSGYLGEMEIFEKFNPETNATGLYLSYGKWGHGWLESNDRAKSPTDVINLTIIWDTDLVQDNYANGDPVGHNYARVYNDTFEFLGLGADEMISYGKFRLGVNLENLPAIPWNPESC